MLGIANREVFTAIFGDWPSFHDAEVLSFRLDRCSRDGHLGPCLDIQIYLFEATSGVDSRGFISRRRQTLATLTFGDVQDWTADGFNGQNVLHDLKVEAIAGRDGESSRSSVVFSTSYGLGMDFSCGSIAVTSADPHDPAE